MIDPSKEPLITFREASDILPRRRGGKKTHISTWYRWSTRGCKGVVLETIQCGGTRVTSAAAVARFLRRLSEVAGSPQSVDLPAARQRFAAEAAERELQREGL
jgi:hypothetical protein